jgi:WD40 repeat protein
MTRIHWLSRPFVQRRIVCAAFLLIGVLDRRPGFLAGAGEVQQPRPRAGTSNCRLDGDGAPLPAGAIARLGTLKFRGCYDPMAYTPDGKYFVCATGSYRVGVAFFESETGRRAFELGGGSSGWRLHFSADGKRLACSVPGSHHNPVWDTNHRKELFKYEASQAGFSADGSRLITVSYYGKGHCRVLDSTSGKLLQEHPLQARQIAWAEVLPCGTKIIFLETDTKPKGKDKAAPAIVLFDLAKKARVATFACAEGRWASVSPDGKTLAVASGSGVRLLDLATGTELQHWKRRSDSRAVFSADGKRLAWSGYDNDLGIAYPWLVDVAGGPPRRLGLATNNFSAPCFTPDGKALVVLCDGNVPEWRDVETGREINPLAAHSGSVWQVRELSDGKHLTSRDHNRLLVWDHFAGKLIRRYPDDLPSGETALDQRNAFDFMMTVHDASGTLRLRDIVTGRELLKLEGNDGFVGRPAEPLAISADGKTAALVSKDYYIRIYDLVTGKVRHKVDPDAAVWNVELSDDGRTMEWTVQRLVSDKRSEGPFVLDTQAGKIRDDGKHLRADQPRDHWTSSDGEVFWQRLRDAKLVDAEGQPIDKNWKNEVHAIQSSPDGRYLALSFTFPETGNIGQRESGAALWDRATGKPLTHLTLQRGMLRFSADGRVLFNGTLDGAIEVWELATGQKRLNLQGHLPGEIHRLLVLQNGRSLASCGSDTQVLLWDLTGRAPDGVWRSVQHSPEKQRALWDVLAAKDAAAGHRAIWELIADPAGSVAFLAKHLRPFAAADAKRVVPLIDDLDSPVFETRAHATAELAKLGEAALPFLRVAQKKPSSLEQSRRLQTLVDDLDRFDLTGDRLRAVRAVEVLHSIGTDAARKVVENWATGFADARLTRESQAALQRLKPGHGSPKR